LNDRILRRRPVHAAFHSLKIDDVCEQVQMPGISGAQELKQALGLTGAGPRVNIGQKYSANLARRFSTTAPGHNG